MASKVNLVLDDDVKAELDALVPTGERSQFANESLKNSLTLLRRRRAVEKLARLRANGPSVPAGETLRLLREARDGR
jgi:hypothetical protein